MEVNIRKRLGNFHLDVQFKTDTSDLGVLGASGSGKSMTLKCIAGIVTPDEGRIEINGRILFDSQKGINVKPQKRKVGYLFQDYALFPTYTAYENIAAGLGRIPAAGKKETVEGLMRRFHLDGLGKHYPHQLSGGQQQRVALARIIACEPDVILLDEPFSALDSHLRLQLQLETKEILKSFTSSIMVTHNRDEAYQFCSELFVLDGGKVTAFGKKEQLFAHPQTKKTAMLIGCKNVSRVERTGDREIRALDWGGLVLRTDSPPDDTIRYVGFHADKLIPVYENRGDTDNTIRIHVLDVIETPAEQQVSFVNADAENRDAQSGVWWDCGRDALGDMPPYLRIPAEDLLLLTED